MIFCIICLMINANIFSDFIIQDFCPPENTIQEEFMKLYGDNKETLNVVMDLIKFIYEKREIGATTSEIKVNSQYAVCYLSLNHVCLDILGNIPNNAM